MFRRRSNAYSLTLTSVLWENGRDSRNHTPVGSLILWIPLYSRIQKRFLEIQEEMYGTDHIYGIDLFNEVTPPSWEPDYLARVGRQVCESLVSADKDAVWLQMTWLFYYQRKDWTERG